MKGGSTKTRPSDLMIKYSKDQLMSCSEHPHVSAILCTRGLRSSLADCLDSLLAQECTNFEVLVVLNGRPDEAFARAMVRYPVRLLNEPRPGLSFARNRGVTEARGEILAYIDDDGVAHPAWLHELVKGFQDPAVACTTGVIRPEGTVPAPSDTVERYYSSERALSSWTLDPADPDCYQIALGGPVGSGCNMAFRKVFLEHYALFPPDLGLGSLIGEGEEIHVFLQVLKHGFRIHHAGSAVVTHRFESDRAKQKARRSLGYTARIAFALKLIFEEKELRMVTARWLWTGLKRRIKRVITRKSMAAEPQEMLSTTEKLAAFARGPLVYWKSRRAMRSTGA